MTTMQGRNWCFTLNNYTDEEVEAVKNMECTYMIFGKEVGKQGTPHLQGYVEFESNKRLAFFKKFNKRISAELRKGTAEQAATYCKKDAILFEKGEISVPQSVANKRNHAEAFEAAKKRTMEELAEDGVNIVAHYRTIKEIKKDYPIIPERLEELDNYWLWGPPGTGKSHTCETLQPKPYYKLSNKWWDGYRGQENVWIDELDHHHAPWIGHYLKQWADVYAFSAEIKGGATTIRPKRIYITSNYHPSDLWPTDPMMVAAITRRFNIIHKNKVYVPSQ